MRSWPPGSNSVRPSPARRGEEPRGRRIGLSLAGIVLAAVCGLPGLGGGQELQWNRLADGLDVTMWNPGARCHDQVPPLLIVKVDPEQFRFSTYHFRDEGLSAPLTIQEWQHRTRAEMVFNAGLFREDYSYLGLLLKEIGRAHV